MENNPVMFRKNKTDKVTLSKNYLQYRERRKQMKFRKQNENIRKNTKLAWQLEYNPDLQRYRERKPFQNIGNVEPMEVDPVETNILRNSATVFPPMEEPVPMEYHEQNCESVQPPPNIILNFNYFNFAQG